jgi:hypothetical protein
MLCLIIWCLYKYSNSKSSYSVLKVSGIATSSVLSSTQIRSRVLHSTPQHLFDAQMIPIFFLMVVQQTHDYLFPTDIYSTCPFLVVKLYRHGNKHTFLFQKTKKQEQQGVGKNGYSCARGN